MALQAANSSFSHWSTLHIGTGPSVSRISGWKSSAGRHKEEFYSHVKAAATAQLASSGNPLAGSRTIRTWGDREDIGSNAVHLHTIPSLRVTGLVKCSSDGDNVVNPGVFSHSDGTDGAGVVGGGVPAVNGLSPGVELTDAHNPAEAQEELSLSLKEIVERLAEILAGQDASAAEAASSLIARVDPKGRACLLSALFASANVSSDEYFEAADANHDGVLDRSEFATYVELQAIKYGMSSKPLTSRQVVLLGMRAAIGMIGFGFTDNFVMILAGDAIQTTIGITWGLSPLMSAGLGNAVADVVGTGFREYIEGMSSSLMPDSRVSPVQMAMKEAWWAETVGSSVGVTIGCILGLFPLLFLNSGPSENASSDAAGPHAVLASRTTSREASTHRTKNSSTSDAASANRHMRDGTASSAGSEASAGESGPPSTEGATLFASVGIATAHPPGTARPPVHVTPYTGLILVLSVVGGVRRVGKFIEQRKSSNNKQ